VIARNDVDWAVKLRQNIGHFLYKYTVYPVILEGIPCHEHEVSASVFSCLHYSARSNQALITHSLSNQSYMDGLHANLPVCSVEEFHDAFR
jgi:hypothetical protein